MFTPAEFPLTRRRFLWAGAMASAAIATTKLHPGALAADAATSLSDLPMGGAPEALALSHFPSRLHAFVWRNWPLVPIDRMAQILGATPDDIRQLGDAMGLRAPAPISDEQWRRSYISIIKRNWHLLPYDQLLELLGWTPGEMAYALREDDFLWIKLGSLKPRCEPLRWTGDRNAILAAGRAVGAIARGELGRDFRGAWPDAFQFVRDLSAPREAGERAAPATENRDLRFCYSYFALYGDPLLEADLDPYPDAYLRRLADVGVTGVWLQAVLYKLTPFPWDPALSKDHEIRLANLRRLAARARERGIRVFLYLNEPRAMPLSFFENRASLRGVTIGDHATLCVSEPAVRDYLTSAVARISREVPELGGFFTITASENVTNCWSHGRGADCPRCARRGPAEVIADVNAAFQDGIDRAGHGHQLIAWDWGWSDAWAAEAIQKLPDRVALQSVSEWSLPLNRGGIQTRVGEYSVSAIGPGPRALRHWELARKRGLKTVAKIQANNTWELAAIPYLPVAFNVAEHIGNLRKLGLDGVMLSWTLGGYPSPNLETVATIMAGGQLRDVAVRRFGEGLADAVLRLWTSCGQAYREFPYDGSVVYNAPLQTGPSNLLWPAPTRMRATMVGFPYDDLAAWRGPFPPDVFAGQLAEVADGFMRAAETLEGELKARDAEDSPNLEAALDEARLARAAGIHFRSVANQTQFVHLRERLRESLTREERERLTEDLTARVRDELKLARDLFELQSRDSRIGFEASNHYFYVPVDLAEKVLNCRWLLDQWIPEQQRAGAAADAQPRQ
jgi:hypothetical protein